MPLRKPKSPREALNIILRHRKKFVFPALILAICIVISSKWMTRMYRSEAEFHRITSFASESMGGRTSELNLQRIRQAVGQDIRDKSFLEQVVKDLGLDRGLQRHSDGELTAQGRQQLNQMVSKMSRSLRVNYRIRSNQEDRIVVRYTHEDRKLVPRVANQVVDNYVRKTRERLDRMLLNAKTFFEREVTRVRTRLSELKERKLHFETEHPGLMPENPGSVQNRVTALRDRVAKAA